MKAFLEKKLKSFVSADALDWCDADYEVSLGKADHELTALAERYDPDLIVIGAHTLGPLGTHGEPGTAFKIMARAHCPVLSLLGMKRKPGELGYKDKRPDLIPSC